jgi:hypothetical protein
MTKELSLKSGKNSQQLNLEQLTDGIYFLKVQSGENTITKKVILDR